jgi:MYXO-CTERM domain-containing protein
MRATLAITLILAAPAARGDAIDNLQPGEWYEVPNSHMRQVDPCPQRTCSYSAVEGQAAVMDDWSGGAFDTQRDRLIIWGGGHGGYAGNEVYAFDLGALTWSRVSEPSDPVTPDVPYDPDGNPEARHTYNYIQYLPPPIDRLVSSGGSAFYQTGQTGTRHVDAFDFSTNKWEPGRFADTPCNNLIGSITAFDPVSGHLFQHGGDQSWLIELDLAGNAWAEHGDQFSGSYVDYYKTAAIDPNARKMVAVGNGEVWTWDLGAQGQISGMMVTTTGPTDAQAVASPGLEYDPTIQELVAWADGTTVYSLNVPTLVWTAHPPAQTNTVTPTARNGNGTFGRFRYSPIRNVYVLVNNVDEDVFVYKLSPGGGVPPADFGTNQDLAMAAGDGGGARDLAGAPRDMAAGAGDAGGGGTPDGCGCTVGARPASHAALALVALLALAALRWRR